MVMSRPDVSVIIAAWKSEDFLERAVRSALASRHLEVEVIIVDDASPDGTRALADRLSATDRRIVVASLALNAGPSAARNKGLSMARGRFIAVMDADDAMLPDRLSLMVRQADATGADIVVDNMVEVDGSGAPLSRDRFLTSSAFAADRTIDLVTWIAYNTPLQKGDCLGYLKPLIRASALPQDRRVYDTLLRNSEDYYLIANLLAYGKHMTYMASAGYLYTRSEGSTSFRLTPDHTRAWLNAEKRFSLAHSAGLSDAARRAASSRLRRLRHVHQFVSAAEALRSARPVKALQWLLADLRGGFYASGLFMRIALGKIIGQRLV